jgi:glycerophosphoryl diester phosphodiesterase
MEIAAHRGVSSLAPENTLVAFKQAIQAGCKWVELDVQLSMDKVPVVFHDNTVDRCTNGNGLISEMTLEGLKLLDAGQWFSKEFINEPIPTLSEILLLAKQTKLHINIEIKYYPEDDLMLLCQEVARVINESNIPFSQLLFSCFNTEALKIMQRIQPQIRRGQLWEKVPHNALAVLREIDAYSAHCQYQFLTEQQAILIKKHHYKLICYTANQPEEVRKHRDWGVDIMITDTPQSYFEISKLDSYYSIM